LTLALVGAEPSAGPTVLDGFVRRTSVSALTSFDPESYAGCPRRWWWQRVAGKSEPETKSQGAGKAIHTQLEEYLGTGIMTLGPIALAGKHLLPEPGPDLHLEARFGDLKTALQLRDEFNATGHTRAGLLTKMERAAGLIAGMIPLDGYIDLRHGRGEWVDSSGVLKKEDPKLGRVVEVVDHKSTSSIVDFAKSPGELVETLQMLGYANYVLNVEPETDHIRLSHIYYQTRGPKLAKKVTGIVSAKAAREGWKRVDKLGLYMEEVATATRAEDVEAQTKSCDAYRGCPHKSYCPVTRSFGKPTNNGEHMSLFNQISSGKTANGAPTTPMKTSLFGTTVAREVTVTPDRSQIDAEKARLAAEDKTLTVNYGFCNDCGTKLTANVISQRGDRVTHIGCSNKVVSTESIVPPDAAKLPLAETAKPLSASALAEVTDPEILRRNKELAQAHADSAGGVEKKGGRCPAGGTLQKVTAKEATSRKIKCSGCSADYKIKDEEFNESYDAVTLRGHNMPKVETSAPPVKPEVVIMPIKRPENVVPLIKPDPEPLKPNTVVPPLKPEPQDPMQASANGITLWVDVMIERGPRPTPLEDYWRPMVRQLEESNGRIGDLRCAPKDNPMAYGAWKGHLAAWVREQPPAPGFYAARSANEFDAVVVDALASLCETVLRGVR